MAGRAGRRRLGVRSCRGVPARSRRALAPPLRLAPGAGPAQRAGPVHDPDRRSGRPLRARPLAAHGRRAAAAGARLALHPGRLRGDRRPAHRPGPRRHPGVPRRRTVAARVRVLRADPRPRLGRPAARPLPGRADGPARSRALPGAGRGLRVDGRTGAGPFRPRARARGARQRPGHRRLPGPVRHRPDGRSDRGRAGRSRGRRRALGAALGLRDDPLDPPADPGVRDDRLPAGPAGLEPGVVRRLRPHDDRADAGRPGRLPDERVDVLVHPHGRVVDAALPGGRRGVREPGDAVGRAHRGTEPARGRRAGARSPSARTGWSAGTGTTGVGTSPRCRRRTCWWTTCGRSQRTCWRARSTPRDRRSVEAVHAGRVCQS